MKFFLPFVRVPVLIEMVEALKMDENEAVAKMDALSTGSLVYISYLLLIDLMMGSAHRKSNMYKNSTLVK